jgi:hypothetical protein
MNDQTIKKAAENIGIDINCPHTIKKFIQDKSGNRIGLMIAANCPDISDGPVVGYSLCNPQDDFDVMRAHEICLGRIATPDRAYDDRDSKPRTIPHSIKETLLHFRDRASRYFKQPAKIAGQEDHHE